MARQYKYRARDNKGQLYNGIILADNESGVAGHIRNKGFYVTGIEEAASSQDIGVWLRNRHPIKTRDFSLFCRQFSTMLEAGLPMLTCLRILTEQTENPRLKDNLQTIYKSVQEGTSLARAMEERLNVFPDIMISMVAAGEMGGVLDVVMQRPQHEWTHCQKQLEHCDAGQYEQDPCRIGWIPLFVPVYAGQAMA